MLEFSLVDGRLLARSSLALLGGAFVELVVILIVRRGRRPLARFLENLDFRRNVALGEILLTLLFTTLLVIQAIVFS